MGRKPICFELLEAILNVSKRDELGKEAEVKTVKE